MSCSRCNSEAIVKRGAASYCAKCAMARDWEDIIAIVQEERVDMEPAQPLVEVAAEAPAPADPAPAATEPVVEIEAAAPAAGATAVAVDSSDLPADPFA